MSATGRNLAGHERHADDFYRTPSWTTRLILPHVRLGARPIDPCAGKEALAYARARLIEAQDALIELEKKVAGRAARRRS